MQTTDPTPPAPSTLMRSAEVAAMLGITPTSLKVRRHRGQGPHCWFRSGRTIFYIRTGVLEWITEQVAAAAAERRAG